MNELEPRTTSCRIALVRRRSLGPHNHCVGTDDVSAVGCVRSPACHRARCGGKLVEIAIGDRFKMSPLGAARCPRLADKEGLIVGGGQYPCTVRVIFDGSKSPTDVAPRLY
jgi:hypothetical protein